MIKSNGLRFLPPLFDWQCREIEANAVDEKIQAIISHPGKS